jgi:hypothetical protein
MTRPSYCPIKLFNAAAYPIARRFVASSILNSAFFHKRPFLFFNHSTRMQNLSVAYCAKTQRK